MKEINLKSLNIKIKPVFLLVFLLMAATRSLTHFILFFLAVTIHELAHILAAKAFRLKTLSIIITPVGQAATMPALNTLCPLKRAVVIIAGPFINFVLAGICIIYTQNTGFFFFQVNLIIALWNLIPAPPLDGGRLFYIILSRFAGVVPANKICKKLSRFIAAFLIAAGFVQTVLYPYNISLLLAAVYLYKISAYESDLATFEFYRLVFIQKEKYKRMLPIKNISAPAKIPVKIAAEYINYDNFIVFYISIEENFILIPENKLVEYVSTNGISGALQDIINN